MSINTVFVIGCILAIAILVLLIQNPDNPLVHQFIKALYSPQVFCLLTLVYLYWKVPTKENLRQGFKRQRDAHQRLEAHIKEILQHLEPEGVTDKKAERETKIKALEAEIDELRQMDID